MDQKQRAGEEAVSFVEDGMVVGLGTGTTAEYFLRALGQRISSGKLTGIRGLPTSRASEALAIKLGIPVTNFSQTIRADITIDGADEIDPHLNLIKGGGGALLREKVVAQNSAKLIIIADESKQVPVLGTRWALPVEVTIFGFETQKNFLQSLGCEPALRMHDGKPFVTDNGNYIYDCRFQQIEGPADLDRKLGTRAGIVQSGLFLGIASVAIVAGSDGVRQLTR